MLKLAVSVFISLLVCFNVNAQGNAITLDNLELIYRKWEDIMDSCPLIFVQSLHAFNASSRVSRTTNRLVALYEFNYRVINIILINK